MRLSVRVRAQNALSRDVPRLECAFPSRRGAREVWGNPPARLRGTMENASTGQMRSSNHPPACGAGCARVRRSLFGVRPHGKAHSAQPVGSECAFPSRRGAREVWGNPPPACGAVAPSSRNGDDHVCDRPRPSCASTRPLKSCGLVQTTAMRVQTPTREVPVSIAR